MYAGSMKLSHRPPTLDGHAMGVSGRAGGPPAAGKWVVRVSGYDPSTGRRRVRQLGTFETKRAALARQKAAVGRRAGGDADTLAEFLEAVWLPAKEGRVEVGTYEQYRWAVTRHIVPMIGA